MNQNVWLSFLSVTFGWLLGLLTPIITNKYQEYKKAKSLKKSILYEIDELRMVMAQIIYLVESKYGGLNYALIDYILSVQAKYNGINKQYKNLTTHLQKIRTMAEIDLQTINESRQEIEFGKSLSLKKYYLPYLQSKINELSNQDDEFQRKSFKLLALLTTFNDNVEESKFFYKLTFDSKVSDENYQIVQQQLISLHQFLARQARAILDEINSFDDK
jgi:hypothetical protein